MSDAWDEHAALVNAFRRCRKEEPGIDDEALAVVVERGIAGLSPEERETVMAAIGGSPSAARIVAELAAEEPEFALQIDTPLRSSGTIWRTALAASILLACGTTTAAFVWRPADPAPVKLLDSSMPSEPVAAPEASILLVSIAAGSWLLVGGLAWLGLRSRVAGRTGPAGRE